MKVVVGIQMGEPDLKIIKDIYKKSITTIKPNRETKSFLPKKNKTRSSLSLFPFSIVFKVWAREITQEKEIKRNTNSIRQCKSIPVCRI